MRFWLWPYNSRTPRGFWKTRAARLSLSARLRRECMPGCWEGCGHLEGHRTERSRVSRAVRAATPLSPETVCQSDHCKDSGGAWAGGPDRICEGGRRRCRRYGGRRSTRLRRVGPIRGETRLVRCLPPPDLAPTVAISASTAVMMLLLLAPALVTAATFRAGGAAVVHKSSLVASAEYPTDPEGLSHMGVVARRSWYELRVGTLTLTLTLTLNLTLALAVLVVPQLALP